MSELSRETDALLRQGRDGESLAPADRSRLKRAVLAQAAAVSVVATTTTAAAWTTVAAKVIGVVVVIGSLAGAAVVLPTWTTPTAKAVRGGAAASPVTTPASARVLPVVSTRVAAPTVWPAVPVAPPPSPLVFPAPAAPPSPAVEPRPSPPASTLEAETQLLAAADDAIKAGDAAQALRILNDHALRFPTSALAPERSAERISALCLAGRRDEARQETSAFLRDQSVGPLAARVRASCGGSSAE